MYLIGYCYVALNKFGDGAFFLIGGNGFFWLDDLCLQMLEMFENAVFGKRILRVTQNMKHAELFYNVAKLAGIKGPSIRIERWVYMLLFVHLESLKFDSH